MFDLKGFMGAMENEYKSPIDIIQGEWKMQMEGDVLRAVQNYGINVNKEELEKALAYDRNQYNQGYYDGLNADKWIPCSERLPEQRKHVLICVDYRGKYSMVGYYDEDFGWYGQWGAYVFNQVIAWQPLPEPYEPKDKEEGEA